MTLGISLNDARALQAALDQVYAAYFEVNGELVLPPPDAPPIFAWQWAPVKSALQTFENVFRAEMQENSAYMVPEKGLSSTAKLVEHGERAFPKDLLHVIGDKAIADFKAAARCFAFNLHTASGFHSARAVEAVIETYYQTFMNKPGVTLNGWHDYVEALKKVKDKKPKPKCIPDARTLLSIDEIRFHHRNPLMHPRAVLTETDADMLFSIAKVAIIAMAQEIRVVWETKKAKAVKGKANQRATGGILAPGTGTGIIPGG